MGWGGFTWTDHGVDDSLDSTTQKEQKKGRRTHLALTRARKAASSRPLKNLQSTVPTALLDRPLAALPERAKASAAKSNTCHAGMIVKWLCIHRRP